MFDLETGERANEKPRVLVVDGFRTHETLEVLDFSLANNIILCRLPSHTSHNLQPCDVGPFAPLTTSYRDQVERLNRGGVDTVGKEHFTYLYSPERDMAMNRRNIRAGWVATGLLLFKPERMLKDNPKPPADLVIPRNDGAARPCPSAEVVHTPVTPVTTEALTQYNVA